MRCVSIHCPPTTTRRRVTELETKQVGLLQMQKGEVQTTYALMLPLAVRQKDGMAMMKESIGEVMGPAAELAAGTSHPTHVTDAMLGT